MKKQYYILLLMSLLLGSMFGQEVAYNDALEHSFFAARNNALVGKHAAARETLKDILSKNAANKDARLLYARTLSYDGKYDKARQEFNKITSIDRQDRGAWISAVKNELYSKNGAIALGLANKALIYIEEDLELKRLRERALEAIKTKVYPPLLPDEGISKKKGRKSKKEKKTEKDVVETADKKKEDTKEPKNTFAIRNGFTVFNEFYDPMVISSIEYKRQTKVGSIIPRINYRNRFQTNGVQYDIDLYPKFSKTFYAYLNYGYSQSTLYPNHKVGGDLYANLPWAMEVSAGGRYMSFDNRNISIISNSIGYYKGNYYFSLRSYITPKPDNLTRFSGNLLVRKYLKDAENFFGLSAGLGYTPDLRQVILDDVVLSETRLFLESQRLNFEYQFTGKNTPNIYRASLGLARQELFSEPGNYVFSVAAGFTYKVKF